MTYDRYGNRTAQTVTAGTGPSNSVAVSATTNRITSSGYAYDANGNMTNDGQNTLVYDAENHAVSAANSSTSATYWYDGNGLRVGSFYPSTYTVYIFSGSKVIAEYVNAGAPSPPNREYVYSGAALLAKIDSTGTHYYHQDHLSNRLVTDSSGNIAAQLGHFPFGESWYNSTNDKLLFTSYDRDSATGNDYAMARNYVSRLARMASPDPIAGSIVNPQSLNRCAYVANDPAELTDPSGLMTGCSTARDETDDPSVPSDSGGVGMLPNEEMASPDPQGGCPGSHVSPWGDGGIWIPVYGYSWQTNIDGPDDQPIKSQWTYGLIGFSFFGGSHALAGDYTGDGGLGWNSALLGPQPQPKPPCTLNIKINNTAGITGGQLTAAESQIGSLYGSYVGVNFITSGSSDYTLNVVNAGPKNTNLGQQTSWLFFQGTPAVYPNNIASVFSGQPASVVNTIVGTVGAHE